MPKLPSPPLLKTTIIQLNKDLDQDNGNFEILTNEYKSSSSSVSLPVMNAPPVKKKRRRSNSNANQEELAKRKFETKQLHSMIEKRRRIKINREFEALKYLIPACRLSKTNEKGSNANNNSKIDGMYKLTILKSSVEYILYLHHLISKQSDIIKKANPDFDFDLNFAKFPLDVNEYRNIDKDFSFKQLIEEVSKDLEGHENDEDDKDNGGSGSNSGNGSSRENGSNEDDNEDADDDDDSFQLPSPLVTPDMQPNSLKYNSPFQLPDPALTLPRKKFFKSVPKNIAFSEEISPMTRPQPAPLEFIAENEENDASKTLLSLRKSSIDSLLN